MGCVCLSYLTSPPPFLGHQPCLLPLLPKPNPSSSACLLDAGGSQALFVLHSVLGRLPSLSQLQCPFASPNTDACWIIFIFNLLDASRFLPQGSCSLRLNMPQTCFWSSLGFYSSFKCSDFILYCLDHTHSPSRLPHLQWAPSGPAPLPAPNIPDMQICPGHFPVGPMWLLASCGSILHSHVFPSQTFLPVPQKC